MSFQARQKNELVYHTSSLLESDQLLPGWGASAKGISRP